MVSFEGKRVIISGGSRGIGLAIAKRLAADGASIAILAKTTEPHPKLPGTIYTAAEEIEHFNRVLVLFFERGGTFGPAQPSPYAEGLLKGWSSRNDEALLDRLIVSGLIEARSLERFVLLARSQASHEGRRSCLARCTFVPQVFESLALLLHAIHHKVTHYKSKQKIAQFI